MDLTAEGSSIPLPLSSSLETETANLPVEPKCLESSGCQARVSNECVPILRTPIATTDVLNDLQAIYSKVQKGKLDSELAVLCEKDKRIDLERQLADKEKLLQKALADNKLLTKALSEKEEEVESLQGQLHEENERFQELGNILKPFRILKAANAEKEIPSKASVDIEPTATEGNTNPHALSSSSSSNRLNDVSLPLTVPPPINLCTTLQTADASVQTDSDLESATIVAEPDDNSITPVKINHGVDRTKSDTGFWCLCGTKMKTKYDLRDHIRRHDPSSYLFQCTRCDKTFCRTAADLRQHMKKQHQLRYSFYGCRTCGDQFPTYLELMSHHRQVHNFKAMNGYTKRSDPFTFRHTKVTSKDPSKFLCSCGKKYNIRKSLNKHINRSRNLIQKKPVVADKVKTQKTEPRHGFAKPDNAKCDLDGFVCICSARLESRRELTKHVQRFEQSYNEEEEDAMSDFSCD